MAAYTRCPRCAGACLGDPGVVPCFHCCSFSACRPLRPRGVHRLHLPSSFTRRWPSQGFKLFGTPNAPTIRFKWGFLFAAQSVRLRYGLSSCLPPWRILPKFPSADEDVYLRVFDESVTLLVAEFNYGGSWAVSTGGTSTRWISS